MLKQLLVDAKSTLTILNNLDSNTKNKILIEMAQSILENSAFILKENHKDMLLANKQNLARIEFKRLALNEKSIENIAEAIITISKFNDPIGNVLKNWYTEEKLHINKVSVPIGVIAIIYESRPNVTSDVAALCFKSSNVCILKGGKEAKNSNRAIVSILQKVLEKNNLPKAIISFLENDSREETNKLIKENQYIDLIIPRGGVKLNQYITNNASIPVINHDRGLCHVYIHSKANISKALAISHNSKCEHPAVCNAMETLLVDKSIASELLLPLKQRFQYSHTKIKGCEKVRNIIDVELADDNDFNTEYLDNILNIKIVEDIYEALAHIDKYSSKHSETIVTEDQKATQLFMKQVDSACVYLNASTKFSEGRTFGIGSEVGISTSKIHARGPIGINELTSYKYQVYGDGQIKISWINCFNYSGLISLIVLGAILSFPINGLILVPFAYISNSFNIPIILTLLLGISILFLMQPKELNFFKMKNIFSKNPKLSTYISNKIHGLAHFDSLPSALSQIPNKGVIIFKILNSTLWGSIFIVLGYHVVHNIFY